MTKCKGCGISLQCKNNKELGYVKEKKISSALYCEKCFKLIHYGKSNDIKDNINYNEIINNINDAKEAIIFIIDVLNLSDNSVKYFNYLKTNKKYVLLSKFDLLPKSVKEKKIIKYFKENFYDKCDVHCIGSKNNYNIEAFYNKLKKDKIKKIYVVGLTNSGKSSFINSLLSNNNITPFITSSPIPNTTHTFLNIKIDNIEFIDTPGFESNSIYNFLTDDILFLIKPKKEIKVKIYQIKSGNSIIVNDLVRIDYIEGHINSFSFYMNDNLNYKKSKSINSKSLIAMPNKTFKIDGKKDIVINGLGFIKINKPGIVKVYTLDENLIRIRNKMI